MGKWVRSHSLSLVAIALFLVAFAGQVLAGRADYPAIRAFRGRERTRLRRERRGCTRRGQQQGAPQCVDQGSEIHRRSAGSGWPQVELSHHVLVSEYRYSYMSVSG